jgi:hypothetical protein
MYIIPNIHIHKCTDWIALNSPLYMKKRPRNFSVTSQR